MSVQKKTILILAPIMILTIILFTVPFSKLFQNFLINEENKQITIISNKIVSFIAGENEQYQSIADDWGHWDDTYNFIKDNNNEFVKNNLDIGSISNLNISFMIFLDKNNTIFHKIKYNPTENNFSDFSPKFIGDFDTFIKTSNLKSNLSGILKLDNKLYFIAMTDVTDSGQTKAANGKIIIGKEIDGQIIKILENTTGCKIVSIATSSIKETSTAGSSGNVHSIIDRTGSGKNPLKIKLVIPNKTGIDSAIIFQIAQTRDLYLTGMKLFYILMLVFLAIMIIISLLLYILLGKFLSKPIISLVKDVKGINISADELNRVTVNGSDEFTFLQNEINNMLARVEAEQRKLKSSEEKLYATLFSVGDGVIAVDKDLKIEFLNPVAERLTGYLSREAIGAPIATIFNIIDEYTGEQTDCPVKKVFEQRDILEVSNHTLLFSKDGTFKAIEYTAAPIKDKFDEIAGCVLVFRDSSERKEKQRKIEYLSYHDQLTGLYNRRYFDDELERQDKRNNLPISIIYADLNGLKTMNDAFGHVNGDKLITIFADTLRSACRAEDIIARIGGDEFIILLPKTDLAQAENFAKRMKEKTNIIKVMDVPISVSFGCDTKVAIEQPIQNILINAENIMYKKKILENESKKNLIVKSTLNTLIVKSPREANHSKRVGILCESIGKAYNLDDYEIIELKTAGELHDIGKIAIDERILNKTSALSATEMAHIKEHPEIGYRLLSNTHEFYNLAEYVLEHHERWDGTGYPKGLKGESINWKSRVLSVADAYDAMTSVRPYHEIKTTEEAIAELLDKSGTQFDPEIVQVFIEKVLQVNKASA